MAESLFGSPPLQTNGGERSSKRIIFIIIGLMLLAAAIFGMIRLLSERGEKAAKPTPAPTVRVLPTDTPTPTASPSATPRAGKASPSPAKKPTATPAEKTTTGLSRADLSIAVQNGSGETGAASKASDYLKGLGYDVVSSGNADSFDYQGVTILVKPAFAKYLDLLKTDLAKQYTVGSISANLSSSTADALVIIGK